jgi:FecR protein
MTSLQRVLTAICVSMLIAGSGARVVLADSSHARIVRLSLVEGDVRFARDVKGDPLAADANAGWEAAVLNLPIRQGYVLATDQGRAVVEFENGAMAFLAENTVLEFYDLSSEDGGFTTRLVLRQGSAEFYVNPARGDYFSVTGGDFSVQAESRTTFRMNNFDDGSNVDVLHGRLTALTKGKSTPLQKNQALSMKAGEPESVSVEQAPGSDDFDQWASGKIQSFTTATASGSQYASSYDYTSGFGDLYTYGAWFPVAGYGNCWRPYGVGFGWSPFDFGSWYYDSAFGWSFLGGQPWGWLPYHYGGWLFRPGVGWVWSPGGSFAGGGVGRWRPVTGVWMRSAGGTVGIVPSHPLDVKGKTPLNLSSGVFAVTPRGVTNTVTPESSDRWKVEKHPARDVMHNQLAEASAPARVPRTMASSGAASGRVAVGDAGSGIVYDRTERRFVNAENPQPATQGIPGIRVSPEQRRSGSATSQVPAVSDRMNGREGQREVVPSVRSVAPARATVPPPTVPRSVTTERAFNSYSGGGSTRGGTSWSGTSTSSSTAATSGSSARASSGSTASSGGGGRPH